MKKEFLEYLIRECVKEVLEAFPQEPETAGAPAPPAGGLGTADQPPLEPASAAPPPMQSAKGVFYVDPKKPGKPAPLKVAAPQDPAALERDLYRTAARSGGPRVKVSSAALREVPKVLSNPNTSLYLYIGKQNEDDPDSELYLLPAKTLQQAQQGSVGAGTSAEHPTYAMAPKEPELKPAYDPESQGPSDAQKTLAPDIDENANLRNMLSSMIRESLRELRK